MGVLFVVLFASVLGLGLVALLVAAGPNPAAEAMRASVDPSDEAPEWAWLGGLSRDEHRRLLAMIFEELRFEVTLFEDEPAEVGAVLLLAEDKTPLKGVRMLVFGLPGDGIVEADVVRRLMELVRGEEAGKGALVTAGRFTDDARKAAEALPIDLVDGEALWGLVKKHLAQIASQRALRQQL